MTLDFCGLEGSEVQYNNVYMKLYARHGKLIAHNTARLLTTYNSGHKRQKHSSFNTTFYLLVH